MLENPDEIVNRWFLTSWVSGDISNMTPPYHPDEHGELKDLRVVSMDTTWECGCYSEYTRDDNELMAASVKTKRGNIEVHYGVWGQLPELINRLVDFGDLDDVCSIENEYPY